MNVSNCFKLLFITEIGEDGRILSSFFLAISCMQNFLCYVLNNPKMKICVY